MKKLLIAGAGGFGREVLFWAEEIPPKMREWEVAGFLDDDADALKGFAYSHKILGPLRGYQPKPDELVLLTLSEPRLKLKMASMLKEAGARFASLVHPTARIGPTVTLGQGCIICPHVCIPCDAQIGDFVHINSNTTVAHDTVIGGGTS